MPIRVHLFVSGWVQGVGFRYFVRQQAAQLSLTGWVRNLNDGRVEALAEGERDSLDQFVVALRKGPRGSQVDLLETAWSEATGEFSEFEITQTV
jgi:acylphosphatase